MTQLVIFHGKGVTVSTFLALRASFVKEKCQTQACWLPERSKNVSHKAVSKRWIFRSECGGIYGTRLRAHLELNCIRQACCCGSCGVDSAGVGFYHFFSRKEFKCQMYCINKAVAALLFFCKIFMEDFRVRRE